MRGFIATLCAILVLMIGFVAFFFVGGTLSAETSMAYAGAAENMEAFAAARDAIAAGRAEQVFDRGEIGSAENYRLVDVNIILKNRGLFGAEWLEVEVVPASGDVGVYSLSGSGTDLSAASRAQLNLKILTAAPEGTVRSAIVRYYVLGMLRSIEVEL